MKLCAELDEILAESGADFEHAVLTGLVALNPKELPKEADVKREAKRLEKLWHRRVKKFKKRLYKTELALAVIRTWANCKALDERHVFNLCEKTLNEN